MGETSIEWTDKTWNPVTGCTKVSAGCKHCYAERVFPRAYGKDRKFTDVRTHEDRLMQPLHWRKPQRIFVNSMSDLFHEDVPFAFIDKVFAVMALTPQHTYQILTKRPEWMREYLGVSDIRRRIAKEANVFMRAQRGRSFDDALATVFMWSRHENATDGEYANFLSSIDDRMWPLPNVWLGVSVEDQQTADERIPLLLQTPAAIRFVSYEPALEYVWFVKWLRSRSNCWDSIVHEHSIAQGCSDDRGLHWVIVGGESGPKARPFDTQWPRDVIAQCRDAGVACFVKQLGSLPMMRESEWRERADRTGFTRMLRAKNARRVPEGFVPLLMQDGHGGDMEEWFEDLRVREFPRSAEGV